MSAIYQVWFEAANLSYKWWLPIVPVPGMVFRRNGARWTVTAVEFDLDMDLFRTSVEVSDARAQDSDAGRRGRKPGSKVPAVPKHDELRELDEKEGE
jgi:hypothetical protein